MHRLPVHKYTATATNKTSKLLSVRESSTFCLKASITVIGNEYRHEVGAACVFPGFAAVVVSPSWQTRLGFVAFNSYTDTFNPNLDQWEGKVSTLLQVFTACENKI